MKRRSLAQLRKDRKIIEAVQEVYRGMNYVMLWNERSETFKNVSLLAYEEGRLAGLSEAKKGRTR